MISRNVNILTLALGLGLVLASCSLTENPRPHAKRIPSSQGTGDIRLLSKYTLGQCETATSKYNFWHDAVGNHSVDASVLFEGRYGSEKDFFQVDGLNRLYDLGEKDCHSLNAPETVSYSELENWLFPKNGPARAQAETPFQYGTYGGKFGNVAPVQKGRCYLSYLAINRHIVIGLFQVKEHTKNESVVIDQVKILGRSKLSWWGSFFTWIKGDKSPHAKKTMRAEPKRIPAYHAGSAPPPERLNPETRLISRYTLGRCQMETATYNFWWGPRSAAGAYILFEGRDDFEEDFFKVGSDSDIYDLGQKDCASIEAPKTTNRATLYDWMFPQNGPSLAQENTPFPHGNYGGKSGDVAPVRTGHCYLLYYSYSAPDIRKKVTSLFRVKEHDKSKSVVIDQIRELDRHYYND